MAQRDEDEWREEGSSTRLGVNVLKGPTKAIETYSGQGRKWPLSKGLWSSLFFSPVFHVSLAHALLT